MSDCENKTRLSAYIDGELQARECAAIERHLAACDSCAAELADLRNISRLIGDWQPGMLSDAAALRIHNALDMLNWRRMERIAGRLAALAASVALVALIWPARTANVPDSLATWEGAAVTLSDEPATSGVREVALAEWMVADLSSGGMNRE